jgi:hypothetical protein
MRRARRGRPRAFRSRGARRLVNSRWVRNTGPPASFLFGDAAGTGMRQILSVSWKQSGQMALPVQIFAAACLEGTVQGRQDSKFAKLSSAQRPAVPRSDNNARTGSSLVYCLPVVRVVYSSTGLPRFSLFKPAQRRSHAGSTYVAALV